MMLADQRETGEVSWSTVYHACRFALLGVEGLTNELNQPVTNAQGLVKERKYDEAIELLERALAISPDAKREAIVAFTLGRVYLHELNLPERAARAFHRARMTDPNGPLAEDALAREVQAWSLAGEPLLARERADEYFERYPSPRRARLVEQYRGGQ